MTELFLRIAKLQGDLGRVVVLDRLYAAVGVCPRTTDQRAAGYAE